MSTSIVMLPNHSALIRAIYEGGIEWSWARVTSLEEVKGEDDI